MGENFSGQDEKPTHRVTISRDYLMGKFEVTNSQYCAVLELGASSRARPGSWAAT